MKLSELFKTKLSAEDEARLAGAQATITALETERDNFKAELATVTSSLNAAKVEIDSANKIAADAKGEIETVKANAAKEIADTKASVDKLAALKALEITGQQVTPPVPAEKPKAEEKKNYTEQCREANAKRGK